MPVMNRLNQFPDPGFTKARAALPNPRHRLLGPLSAFHHRNEPRHGASVAGYCHGFTARNTIEQSR